MNDRNLGVDQNIDKWAFQKKRRNRVLVDQLIGALYIINQFLKPFYFYAPSSVNKQISTSYEEYYIILKLLCY